MEVKIVIRIVGISPLLVNSPQAMLTPKPNAGRGQTRKLPTPEEESRSGLYPNDGFDGHVFPTLAPRKAMLEAARRWTAKIGRTTKTIMYDLRHIYPTEEFALLRDPVTDEPLTEYVIDTRRVVTPGGGARVCSRPLFPHWSMTFTFIYDPSLIPAVALGDGSSYDPEALIGDVMNDAGSRVGLGNFRPEKGGWFGRFHTE